MQEETREEIKDENPKKALKKRAAIALSVAVVMIGAIVVTVFILSQIFGNRKIDTKKVADTHTASSIVSAYSKPKAIEGLSDRSYTLLSGKASSIQYKQKDLSYPVTTTNDQASIFVAKYSTRVDDSKTIINQTVKLLANYNMKLDSYTPTKTASNVYNIFSSTTIVCQLTTTTPTNTKAPRQYTFSCVSKSDIQKEYNMTEKLLTIYGKASKPGTFTRVTRSSKQQGNKSYSIVNLIGNNLHNKLLFAAIDDKWEYLGDLGAGIGKSPGSKYSISPELEAKINDPKYGDFLVENIK